MPHANLSDLALLCDSSMTATITSTGWSITASSIYVAISPIHHHHSSSLALVERRSSPSFRKCENSSRDGRSAKFTELSRTHPQSSRQTHPPSFQRTHCLSDGVARTRGGNDRRARGSRRAPTLAKIFALQTRPLTNGSALSQHGHGWPTYFHKP